MEKQTTIIEVNGVKLEVDLRSAKRIDQLSIGSRVKCLVKGYGASDFATYPGVIVGFDPFPSKPTMNVAYLDTSYGGGLKFKAFNSDTKDFEVVADIDNNRLEIDRDDVLRRMDREIDAKRIELEKLESARAYFLTHFGRCFDEATVGGVSGNVQFG
jgi:hypothetical protein